MITKIKHKSQITVLIPTYNVEKYIIECLESVLNQTFQDFDVLIIDDASTDNTVKLISTLEDSRIAVFVKEKNKGLIDSLNVGFEMCKNKYIARVDGDDINDLTRFEKQFNFLESHPEIAACGSWLQSFGGGNRLIKHKETHDEIMCAMFHSAPMNIGATMFKREAYKGYLFDDNMWHAEDYDFWARTGFEKKMHNLQEPLYLYRIHDTQVCSRYKPIQAEKKKVIKLRLWKTLNYDESIYSDEFIIKMLMTNKPYSLSDFIKFKTWSKQILASNVQLNVYNQNYFEIILKEIEDDILKKTFSKNKRHISNSTRVKLLFILSFKWKIRAIIMLIKAKLKKYN